MQERLDLVQRRADVPLPDPGKDVPHVRTRPDGTFLFEGVPAGRWTIAALRADASAPPAASLTLTVSEARDATSLELDVPSD